MSDQRPITTTILVGDVRARLADLPAASVHCVVTSPPYYGLRTYHTAEWTGGDPACDHAGADPTVTNNSTHRGVVGAPGPGAVDAFRNSSRYVRKPSQRADRPRAGITGSLDYIDDAQTLPARTADQCPACGAERVDLQIGLEETPTEYIAALVDVFRDVRRVLRPDGTLWINLGDSYANDAKWGGASTTKNAGFNARYAGKDYGLGRQAEANQHKPPPNSYRDRRRTGYAPKSLMGMPWRLAIALQDDGWILRQDNIWHKPNPLPESVTDRTTKAHEYLFHFSPAPDYYYDRVAIQEAAVTSDARHSNGSPGMRELDGRPPEEHIAGTERTTDPTTRNKRSVWSIATAPFTLEYCSACRRLYDRAPHAKLKRTKADPPRAICRCGASDRWLSHFATYPPALVEPVIKAATSEAGACVTCGAPWERVVETEQRPATSGGGLRSRPRTHVPGDEDGRSWDSVTTRTNRVDHTLGWRPTCACQDTYPVPATVLDPFGGAGTTALVAERLGRRAVLIELNPDYADLARQRIERDGPLFSRVVVDGASYAPIESLV